MIVDFEQDVFVDRQLEQLAAFRGAEHQAPAFDGVVHREDVDRVPHMGHEPPECLCPQAFPAFVEGENHHRIRRFTHAVIMPLRGHAQQVVLCWTAGAMLTLAAAKLHA